LLGLTNLTWDSLQGITGFGRDNVTKVEYREKATVTDLMKSKQAELHALIMAKANNVAEEAKKILIEMTEFVGTDGNKVAGKHEISKLSEKQLDICIRKMKEGK
jgi:succinate dehydrogenase flavin-adding protein (antitoxin of CptAB toxin-antitoxin module)